MVVSQIALGYSNVYYSGVKELSEKDFAHSHAVYVSFKHSYRVAKGYIGAPLLAAIELPSASYRRLPGAVG